MKNYLLIILWILLASNVFCQSVDKTQLERLKTFNQLYGYVKYFHPSDEAAALDWDAFAIYGVNEILSNKEEDFKSILNRLFQPIAPSLLIFNKEKELKQYLKSHRLSKEHYQDTVYWQHLGNGLNNSSSTYQSTRVNKLRDVFPDESYYNGYYINILKDQKLDSGKYKISYRIENTSPYSNCTVIQRICTKNMSDESICEDSQRFNGFQRTFNENIILTESTNHLGLKLLVIGNGILSIGQIKISLFKNNHWEDIYSLTGHGLIDEIEELSEFDHEYSLYKFAVGNDHTLLIKPDTVSIKNQPTFEKDKNLSRVINKSIGSGLFCYLPLELLQYNHHTLPLGNQMMFDSLSHTLRKLEGTDLILVNNPALRIGNVINVWNNIRYFFPYKSDLKINWGSMLNESLQKSFMDQTKKDHKETLERMLSKLNDSHVYVIDPSIFSQLFPDFGIGFIEGKVIITDASVSDYMVETGDEIVRINDVPIMEALRSASNYISSGVKDDQMAKAIRRTFGNQYSLDLSLTVKNKEDLIKEIHLKRDFNGGNFNDLIYSYQKKEASEDLGNGLYYINLDILQMKEFKEILPNLNNAKNIIIDMRGYPIEAGLSRSDFLGHFIEKNIHPKWLFVEQIYHPNQDQSKITYDASGWKLEAKQTSIKAHIYFLINHEAVSYAESLTGYFANMENVTLVGSPTAGANGNVNTFDLPGGYRFRYTGMKVLKHDGSRLHGIGFLPDVEVRPTIQGIIEGRDEVLEKAIELTKGNN